MPFCAHSADFGHSALWGVAMRIELAQLEDGKAEFAKSYEPDALALDDERFKLCGPASVSGKVRLSGAEVIVKGHLDSCIAVDCDRCLRPIKLPVAADFELEYISGSDYEIDRNLELTEDLMSISVFDGESIDVDEIVKEQLFLAVPTRSLCKEDCKGFCPTCGADKNAAECGCESSEIDPRWAVLKDLKSGK
jgi:uncharacterized protein